jgi:predicted neuraminidase
MKRAWLPLAAFALALLLNAPQLKPLRTTRFLVAPPVASPAATSSSPTATPLPAFGPSAHSASLTELADGRIALAWFAGSREGASDVAIVMSILDHGTWSAPRPIVQRADVARDLGRVIRKLGNPLLWRDPQGVLHCWFVSVSYGGWAGSAINHIASNDGGASWSPITRLITSPFFNLSTLVHNPPIALEDGGVGLPIYHEFIAKRGEWLRLDSAGRVVDKTRVGSANKLFQPAVATLDADRALMLLRDAGPSHRLHASITQDAGRTWQRASATPLANPDAGIALLRLSNGHLLLAYNPQESNRTELALSISRDNGATWSPPKFIERGQAEDEFSYPALLQDASGTIHLAYTWKRQTIKHLSLPPGVLETNSDAALTALAPAAPQQAAAATKPARPAGGEIFLEHRP